MAHQFCTLWDDVSILNRARFSLPMTDEGIDAQFCFMQGGQWKHGDVAVEMVTAGAITEWNYLANSTIPLVTTNVAEAIAELIGPAFQRIPASIAERNHSWEILGLPLVHCAYGDPRSPFEGVSPTIDSTRIGDAEFFRLPSFAVIASRRICDILTRNRVSGVVFSEVRVSV